MRPFARVILNDLPASSGRAAPPTPAEADIGAELVTRVKGAFWSHVSPDGRLDYAALRASDGWRNAGGSAARLRRLDPRALEPPARRALWINVYNALVLHGIVALGLRRSVWEAWNFFGRISYRVGDFTLSADEIEHGLLRGNRPRTLPPWPPFRADDPRLALACAPLDPRIHFALNCGAQSCPPVGVYRGDLIDAQLDLAARSFVNQDVVLAPGGVIACSRIFKWYRRDFGETDELRAFLLRYLDEGPVRQAVAAGAPLGRTFLPYSWALPHAAGAPR